MNIPSFLSLLSAFFIMGMISGCGSNKVGFAPDNKDFGGGAKMVTNIILPKPGQIFPAGQDIPITAVAGDLSGVKQVVILVNNKPVAKDSQPPYTAVISKPVPGKYGIQSYATSPYGDSQLSSVIFITVK